MKDSTQWQPAAESTSRYLSCFQAKKFEHHVWPIEDDERYENDKPVFKIT